MKRKLFIYSALMLLCIFAGPATAQQYNAVVVGIEEYDWSTWLNYAVDDAEEIADALVSHHGWDENNITLLTDEGATSHAIGTGINGLPKGANDICLYYHAGHGDSPELGGNNGTLPHDDYVEGEWQFRSPTALQNGFGSTYTQFTAIIDACGSGTFVDDMSRGVILSACDSDELSYEDRYSEHGYYTNRLIEGMTDSLATADSDSDGRLTAEELDDYADDRTTADNANMHPQMKDAHSGPLYISTWPGIPPSLYMTGSYGDPPTLNWSASSDASKYMIYRNVKWSSTYYLFDSTTSLTYVDNEREISQPPYEFIQSYYVKAKNAYGESAKSNTTSNWVIIPPKLGLADNETIPDKFGLDQNYPNPFNPVTTIHFQLPEARYVKLVVFDITGKEVARLADQNISAGFHAVEWDASNEASGIYFYKITAGNFNVVKRMILVK